MYGKEWWVLGNWGCPTLDVTLWSHGLIAHESLEGTGCAPGFVSSGGNLACVLWNCCAQQTKAQQMEMTGRTASKAWSEPKHQCCWMLGLPSQFPLHHWNSHAEGRGLLLSPVLCSLQGEAISGSNTLSCWGWFQMNIQLCSELYFDMTVIAELYWNKCVDRKGLGNIAAFTYSMYKKCRSMCSYAGAEWQGGWL